MKLIFITINSIIVVVFLLISTNCSENNSVNRFYRNYHPNYVLSGLLSNNIVNKPSYSTSISVLSNTNKGNTVNSSLIHNLNAHENTLNKIDSLNYQLTPQLSTSEYDHFKNINTSKPINKIGNILEYKRKVKQHISNEKKREYNNKRNRQGLNRLLSSKHNNANKNKEILNCFSLCNKAIGKSCSSINYKKDFQGDSKNTLICHCDKINFKKIIEGYCIKKDNQCYKC